MVCFVNGSSSALQDEMNNEDKKPEIVITDDDDDDLTLQRIAGGSVIEFAPVFSPNGDTLFVVSNSNIRAYSTLTGEWIRDLEGISGRKIIGQQCDLRNPKLLYACTEAGDVVSWKWKSGVLHEKIELRFAHGTKPTVLSFALVPAKGVQLLGLVTWTNNQSKNIKYGLFELSEGFQRPLKVPTKLKSTPVKIAVGSTKNNFFAMIQDDIVHFVDYEKNESAHQRNIKRILLTCIACHPVDKMVITGDETGRILLYREIFKIGEPMSTLYAWHQTAINTIAFSQFGTNFYSSASENVLVRWNLREPKERSFLPRLWGSGMHIVIAPENERIAVALNDNEIQILNPQHELLSVIQNFTWVPNDRTNIPKFPIGLKVNPRTSCLVMNGRIGHLQFYSTHTKSLLFNLDTTVQNRLNVEREKVLYNTYISHAALNMDWLATAELLNDQHNTIESRLKFWHYDLEKQAFALNTQIELPHENGLRALEFSSPYTVDNLLCATCGEFDLKVWALEESENIHRKGLVWQCIGRTSYRDYPIRSLAFSSDTSLVAAGFGNTLCVFTSETLRLKCVLSAPAGLDGSANKLTISMPTDKIKSDLSRKRSEFLGRRNKMLALIKSLLEDNNSKQLVQQIAESKLKKRRTIESKSLSSQHLKNMTVDEREMICKQLLTTNELTLFQKINLFDKLNLRIRASAEREKELTQYCERNSVDDLKRNILRRIYRLSPRNRFQFYHKFSHFNSRSPRTSNVTAALKRTFNFKKLTSESVSLTNGVHRSPTKRSRKNSSSEESVHPLKHIVQVNHVVFCTGEYAHLVIVCTDSRVLIWNLLTLRLQSSFKLSVERINVDVYTNLVAVITTDNELFVFLPNTPIPLYQRKITQRILGLAWIPRRHPKTRSLNVDWQATTELFFLSEDQELLRLVSSNDMESFTTNASYLSDSLQPLPFTPFAAMIAKQQHNYATPSEQDQRSANTYGIGVLGKNSIKELTGLQTHTMAPVSLLCNRFLKSLLIDEVSQKKTDEKNDGDSSSEADDNNVEMDSDDD